MNQKLSHAWLFLKSVVRHWIHHNADRYAASLSYYAVFSLAPLLLVVVAIGGVFFGEAALRGEIATYLSSVIGIESAQFVERIIATAQLSDAQAISIIVGIGFLLFSALRAVGELEYALHDMLMFERYTPHGGWKRRVYEKFISLLIVFGFSVYLLVFVIGQYLINRATDLIPASAGIISSTSQVLIVILQITITTVFIALLYRYIPRIHIPWRKLLPSALITSLLLLAGQYAIQTYLQYVPIDSSLCIAGSLIAVMLWTYYSALIFFFGVSITHIYSAMSSE